MGDEAEKRARLLLGCLGRRAVLLVALGRCGEADDLDLFVLQEWDARGLLRWFSSILYSDQSLPLRTLQSGGTSSEMLSRPIGQLERMRAALKEKGSKGPLRELVLMHLGQAYWRLGPLDKFLEVAGENVDGADAPMIARLGASDPDVATLLMQLAFAYEDRGELREAKFRLQKAIAMLEEVSHAAARSKSWLALLRARRGCYVPGSSSFPLIFLRRAQPRRTRGWTRRSAPMILQPFLRSRGVSCGKWRRN